MYDREITNKATEILSSRAVLSGIKVSLWKAAVLDKEVSAEVAGAKKASRDSTKVTKHIVPWSSIDPIQRAASKAIRIHKSMTAPWTDDGLRILVNDNHSPCMSALREAIAEFDALADKFASDYPSLIDEKAARERLGEMYDAADFPDPATIRDRFRITLRTYPMPTAADFRCQLSAEAMAEAKASVDEANRQALLGALKDTWNRAREVVAFMAQKLPAYHDGKDGQRIRGKFHDTLVTNVIEVVGRLPGLNILNDPHLAAVAERMENELCYYDAGSLREDGEARKATTEAAEAILADIDAAIALL